jgi:hypothetical protein
VAVVGGELRINAGGSFSSAGEGEGNAGSFNARPVDAALIAGNINAEKAVGGVVRLNGRGCESHGGNNAKCGLDKSTAFHLLCFLSVIAGCYLVWFTDCANLLQSCR